MRLHPLLHVVKLEVSASGSAFMRGLAPAFTLLEHADAGKAHSTCPLNLHVAAISGAPTRTALMHVGAVTKCV
jgi:hypothetical protein